MVGGGEKNLSERFATGLARVGGARWSPTKERYATPIKERIAETSPEKKKIGKTTVIILLLIGFYLFIYKGWKS